MLLCYIWACVVALFQAILVVNSPRYKSMYGNDPLAHWNVNQGGGNPHKMAPIIENIKLYPSPDFTVRTSLKEKDGQFPTGKFRKEEITMSPAYPDVDYFSNEFNDLQYRTAKNNMIRNRGYGYSWAFSLEWRPFVFCTLFSKMWFSDKMHKWRLFDESWVWVFLAVRYFFQEGHRPIKNIPLVSWTGWANLNTESYHFRAFGQKSTQLSPPKRDYHKLFVCRKASN